MHPPERGGAFFLRPKGSRVEPHRSVRGKEERIPTFTLRYNSSCRMYR